jgi:hypothetical protein
MALSAFDDKSAPPAAGELAETLGRTSLLWDDLLSWLEVEFEPLETAWQFSGQKWGWSLRSIHRKRTILYLTPCSKHFLIGFVLGEKAVKACHDNDLPADILAMIGSARKYAEGRGIRIEVRNKKTVAAVKRLAAIKMAN